MARLSRYSRWDGTQAVPDLDADELLSAMSDDLLADGDLWNALRRLFQRGAQDPQGGGEAEVRRADEVAPGADAQALHAGHAAGAPEPDAGRLEADARDDAGP